MHQLGARVESLKEYLVSLDKRKQVSDARTDSTRSPSQCRGTSLIRNSGRLGPYSKTMPRALCQS